PIYNGRNMTRNKKPDYVRVKQIGVAKEEKKERGDRETKMEVPGSSKKMIATQEEMVAAKVPLGYRDQCAHLLIPLNKCRQAEFFLPWKMLAMQKIREEEAKAKQDKKQGNGVPLIPKTANA
ncbi:hypothetical protein HID58_076530, partial [Brassica napus]